MKLKHWFWLTELDWLLTVYTLALKILQRHVNICVQSMLSRWGFSGVQGGSIKHHGDALTAVLSKPFNTIWPNITHIGLQHPTPTAKHLRYNHTHHSYQHLVLRGFSNPLLNRSQNSMWCLAHSYYQLQITALNLLGVDVMLPLLPWGQNSTYFLISILRNRIKADVPLPHYLFYHARCIAVSPSPSWANVWHWS